MKKILFVAMLTLGVLTINAQGINFFEGTFKEALTKAAKEDKLIFVDAFTTWCGPCKLMSKHIFTDPSVGQYYNDNFINLKIDQEKGEGLDFAQKYEVQFYPSLFFINEDGEVAHKAIGSMDAQQFLALGAAANDNSKQLLSLQNQYDKGTLDVELLKNLANALQVAYLPGAEKVAQEYLETQSNWKSEENIWFMYNHFPSDINNDVFQFILSERALFDKTIGSSQSMEAKISEAIEQTLAAQDGGATNQAIDKLFKEYYPKDWERMAENYKINVLSRHPEDTGKKMYIERKLSFIEKYGEDSWQELNAFAWLIYENSVDKEQLKAGQKLALQSIEIDQNFYNTDTYVWISEKLGDKKAIKAYAPIAIKLGKADDADISELEALLNKY